MRKALFIGGTGTISSASAYQKPLASPFINEGTSLSNPYWEYSRNKIACEEFLMKKYREEGYPVTIIRPSHTYDNWCDRVIAAQEEAARIVRQSI